MATYLVLNLAVIISVVAVILMSKSRLRLRRLVVAITALLVLTAVFDSLIIANGIVVYHSAKLIGVYVGRAPVEDFAYALVAAVLMPFLWEKFGTHAK